MSVKLQPFRQSSLSRHKFNKLSKRYYGPFRIIKTISIVAYRLALPEPSKIHNVFHCSLLKPHHGPTANITTPLPPQAADNHPLIEPLNILNTKWDDTTSPPSLLALVQWKGLAPEETSWEHWDDICTTYHLEENVVLLEGGIDTNLHARPKREARAPTYLQDYVQT